MSTFNLSNRVKLVNASPNVDDDYGPYVSITAATTAISTLLRKAGKTVGIYSGTEVREYWWPDDVTLSDNPVLKISTLSGLLYQGTWNASTNNPTLTSSVGTAGHYYIISVVGSTNLNGITDWQIGDWAIFEGSVWQKIDNTDTVVSVNGLTGVVNLSTATVPENTNLYYTDARSRLAVSAGTGIFYNNITGEITSTITQYTDSLAKAALSFAAGSGAYNSISGVITIPTNNNQISNGAAYIVLASLSAGAGIDYNNTTGVITSTIIQYTDTLAREAISLTTTGSSGNSTYSDLTGVLNVPSYTLSGLGGQSQLNGIGFIKASGTTISYDNSTYLTSIGTGVTNQLTYWNGTNSIGSLATSTYPSLTELALLKGVTGNSIQTQINSKQPTISLTSGYIPRATGSSTLGNSLIQDNGTTLGIGSISNLNKLTIADTVLSGSGLNGLLLDLKQTWNTALTATAIKLSISDVASSETSLFTDFKAGATGSTVILQIGKTGNITWGILGTEVAGIGTAVPTTGFGNTGGKSIYIGGSLGSLEGYSIWLSAQSGNRNPTTGICGHINTKDIFTPTSGTATYNILALSNKINQTGNANGITRGLYVNPELTSAIDFRAIEVVKGSIVLPYQAASATYAIKTSDYLIDFTTGTFAATLPTAVGCQGKTYVLKNSGTGVITIATTSSQTIDGLTTSVLGTQYLTITVVSNGANWIKI